MKWKWPKKRNINGAILNPCHWPLGENRKQSRKRWHTEHSQPQHLGTHSWCTAEELFPRSSSGREVAKHLQQIFRKVFSFHFVAISQASPPSDSLSGYQPRSLTLEVADKRFHVKTDRQNWQEPTATATWLQILVGTEPETKSPDLGWYKRHCLAWAAFFWHARSLSLGRAAGQCGITDLSPLVYPQQLKSLYHYWGYRTAIQSDYLVLQLKSQAIICHSHREHLSPFSQPLNECVPYTFSQL